MQLTAQLILLGVFSTWPKGDCEISGGFCIFPCGLIDVRLSSPCPILGDAGWSEALQLDLCQVLYCALRLPAEARNVAGHLHQRRFHLWL
jgi:hypothetical protein